MKTFPGLTGKKRSIVFVLLITVGIVLIVDPFHWIGQNPVAPKRNFSAEQIKAMSDILKTDGKDARELVAQTFSKKRIILVGTQNFIKEELVFVQNIISALPEMGVHLLGLEFIRAEDQGDIDRLVAAPDFDATLAKELVFRRLPLWGYSEYLDVLKAAWQTNKTSTHGALRVVGLALTQNFSSIHNDSDLQDPAILKGIYAQGRPDSFMAATVMKYLSAAGNEHMLVMSQRVSSLTTWDDKNYTDRMAGFGFPGEKRMGVILKEKLGSAIATLLFHSPFPSARSPVRAAFPLDGLIDAALETNGKSPLPFSPSAYELAGTRLGAMDCGVNDFNQQAQDRKEKAVQLSDLGDIYVIFGPIHLLHTITAIPDFITSANIHDALKILPTIQEPDQMNPGILNDEINQQAKDFEKALADFR